MISIPRKISNISIIIPTLNEAENLSALQPLTEMVAECIVVDGGSNDGTVRNAQKMGFIVEECSGGRGAQLNHGAARATAPILLFLHADTLLPADFPLAITECLADPETIMGAFRLQIQNGGILLQLICSLANIRSRFLQLPYGDQSFFLRKKIFGKLKGFPEQAIMEDFIFVKRAKKLGSVVTLQQKVVTSGRRWQRLGVIRTTCINQLVITGFYLGVPLEKLALFYRRGCIFGKLSGHKRPDHSL